MPNSLNSLNIALAAANLIIFIAGGIVAVRLMRRELELVGNEVKENSVWIEKMRTEIVGLSSDVRLMKEREKWDQEQRSRVTRRLRK